MRTIVIVPLLLLAFTLVGKPAQAENVLYCQSKLATGFAKDDLTKIWKVFKFELDRWTLKFNDDFTAVEGLGSPYNCKKGLIPELEARFPYAKEVIACRSGFEADHETYTPMSFMFNKNTMRFVFFKGSLFGYLTNNLAADTDTLFAGTCEQF